MKYENRVTLVILFLSIIIFTIGTIIDRIYFHQNIDLGLTLIQNSVELIMFLIGVSIGIKIK